VTRWQNSTMKRMYDQQNDGDVERGEMTLSGMAIHQF
jgi:hypothetical protein